MSLFFQWDSIQFGPQINFILFFKFFYILICVLQSKLNSTQFNFFSRALSKTTMGTQCAVNTMTKSNNQTHTQPKIHTI